jgi:uncharacterized protein
MTPSGHLDGFGRIRSFALFVASLAYFLLAERVSGSVASGLSSGELTEVVYRSTFLFLLLAGYAAMGLAFQRQGEPFKAMGMVRRSTASQEFALGGALGWGMMIACVLPIALLGGLRITLWTTPRQFWLLILDLFILAMASLLEEVAFRGYPFQRLIEAVGPLLATLLMSVLFALRHLQNPDATQASVVVTVFAGWLLSAAYLRTRALWLAWGFHFSWNATMGLLFGLPISGIRTFSPVIESNASGPYWLTGGHYGPEGSLICAIVLLGGIIVLFALTRDYAYQYAQPVIIPGGIPVDVDASAQRQHDAAMASPAASPAAPKLIQIAPVAPPPALPESRLSTVNGNEGYAHRAEGEMHREAEENTDQL